MSPSISSSENSNKVVEGVELVKTTDEFLARYQALCQETGYQIVIAPIWIKRDDGTYSTQIQTSIGELPKEK